MLARRPDKRHRPTVIGAVTSSRDAIPADICPDSGHPNIDKNPLKSTLKTWHATCVVLGKGRKDQTETDCTLNTNKKVQIVLASPESVYYLTTTPLLTNTKQDLTMNTKTLAIAIAFAAGSAFASSVQAAPAIVTLDTVQVRPSADQIAQAEVERTSSIPTLAVVEVRPTAGLIADYRAELTANRRVTTLAAIDVRPTAEQRQALAAEQTTARGYVATFTAAATAVANEVIINLPTLQVRPSPADLQALALETAAAAASTAASTLIRQ